MVRFQICHCGLWLNWSDVGRTGGARLSGRGLAAAAFTARRRRAPGAAGRRARGVRGGGPGVRRARFCVRSLYESSLLEYQWLSTIRAWIQHSFTAA
jgi:hypothetical protein